MSWGPGNHSKLTPGTRPTFLKAKFHKESRNGFKTINYRRYPVMIFKKTRFSTQKILEKIGHFVDFCIFAFLCKYICLNKTSLKKIIVGVLESVQILTKF
jgi:hypothetical protein